MNLGNYYPSGLFRALDVVDPGSNQVSGNVESVTLFRTLADLFFLDNVGHPIQTLPLSAAALREVDIMGVFRYANTYDESIEIVQQSIRSGIDLTKLVTHRFKGFQEAPKAFEMAGKTKDENGKLVLKVVIESIEETMSSST